MTNVDASAGPTTELLQAMIRNACVNDGTAESGHEWRSDQSTDAPHRVDVSESCGRRRAEHPGRAGRHRAGRRPSTGGS